jgi:hypothetical protein
MAKALRDYTAKTAAVGNTTLHEPGTIQPAWIRGVGEALASTDRTPQRRG